MEGFRRDSHKCQIAQSHCYGCVRHGEILNAIIILNFFQSKNYDLMLIYVLRMSMNKRLVMDCCKFR